MLVDFELIKRAQQGDGAAFNEIVLAYRKRILGTITRLIARPEDVEDVAQEVFLRLYFSLDQLREEKVFEPWLYRLTVNAAFDYLRKLRRRQEFRMSDLSEQQVMLADAMAGGKADHDEQHQKNVARLRTMENDQKGDQKDAAAPDTQSAAPAPQPAAPQPATPRRAPARHNQNNAQSAH